MEEILKLIANTEGEAGGTDTNTLTTENVVEQVGTVEATETQTETKEELPSKYDIDGEEFSIDEIREWRKGNLRQSDYTKKTTELAKQRKEAEEALEVYNYLMSRQDLVQKLYELDTENPDEVKKVQGKLDPIAKQVQELNQKLIIKDIEAELNNITSKDKMVTDVELLEIANQMKCPIDTAYNIWKGQNMDKVIKTREAELKRELLKEIQTNKAETRTLISQTDGNNDKGTYGLSDEQVLFAEKVGMSPEEYSKYMKNPY